MNLLEENVFFSEFDDLQQSSTVLAVMIRSVIEKYEEVIALHSVSKLTLEILHTLFLRSLKLLNERGLNPIAVVVDNSTPNRNLLMNKLCSGKIVPFIPNPNPVSGERLHLLWDSVHNYKNVYNNWIKEVFISIQISIEVIKKKRQIFDAVA